MEQRAAAVFTKLLEDTGCGEHIKIVSGYRTYGEQRDIYTQSLRDNGAEFTAKYVALPGHSEHQSGLAVDLSFYQPNERTDFIRPSFPYTGICGAFREKATEYGFIERYQRGKEHITGIAHEPWHFRYVGAPHAKIMRDKDFVLEEYLDWIKDFSQGNPFRYVSGSFNAEIFYHAADKDGTRIELADDLPHTVSGDNMDGFVVTLWRRGQ
jgi:D-alanyl-D-alanine dipeptidase/carboxypeptidase